MKDEKQKIVNDAIPSDREYKITKTGKDGRSLVTTLPRGVIKREAQKRNMTIDEFIENLRIVWYADDFEGMHLIFVERENDNG